MLVIENLDDATVERAGALIAREHAAARQVRPELPAAFGTADVCAAALQRLRDSGHHGLVATEGGHTLAVMTATVRPHPAGGRYARLPAEGVAVDPDLADPTGVLAVVFGDLASPLIAGGVLRYYLLHAALPRLPGLARHCIGLAEPRLLYRRAGFHRPGAHAVLDHTGKRTALPLTPHAGGPARSVAAAALRSAQVREVRRDDHATVLKVWT
jgi:hypothetical protein